MTEAELKAGKLITLIRRSRLENQHAKLPRVLTILSPLRTLVPKNQLRPISAQSKMLVRAMY
jgi:hypothetical protein